MIESVMVSDANSLYNGELNVLDIIADAIA